MNRTPTTEQAKIRAGWKWIGVRFGIPLILIGIAMIVYFFTNLGVGAPSFLPYLPTIGAFMILLGFGGIVGRYRF